MSSTPLSSPPLNAEEGSLVYLVLQSKKALQQGEQLGTKAHELTNQSAQHAVDVLALDARIRYISNVVIEQLEATARVSKSIQEKRLELRKQAEDWDNLRLKRTEELETILDALGNQHVPPEFHQLSEDSSLFGSQHSDDEQHNTSHAQGASPILHSPTATLRAHSQIRRVSAKGPQDRQNWKTLRDFVDEKAIVDALEIIENDKTALYEIMKPSEGFDEALDASVNTMRAELPEPIPTQQIAEILDDQDVCTHKMAKHLEDLTSHYDQMVSALKDTESGEAFSREDIQDMRRDTAELPAIMAELEDCVAQVEKAHDILVSAKQGAEEDLAKHHSILDDLDELSEMTVEMQHEQAIVENEFSEHLIGLEQHVQTLETLRDQFIAYRKTFHKLLLEIARRRQYREAALTVVRGMQSQLNDMVEEELQARARFNAEHGAHLPEDLCLCVGNEPTRWDVTPWDSETMEILPDVDQDLLDMARESLSKSITVNGKERVVSTES